MSNLEYTTVEEQIYIAHLYPDHTEGQSVAEHNRAVSAISEKICPAKELTNIVKLAGILHDAGKYGPKFQDYMRKIKEGTESYYRGEANHSTAGGLLLRELSKSSNLTDVLSVVIFSHHGLQDCIHPESGQTLLDRRRSKTYQEEYDIDLDIVRRRFYSDMNEVEIAALCENAAKELKEKIMTPIKEFMEKNKEKENKDYGSRDFHMGMYVRLLLSVLIDGDRIDTANYRNRREIYDLEGIQDRNLLWKECIDHYEEYTLKKFSKGATGTEKINRYRSEISGLCMEAGKTSCRLYRLTVPTGAGKTLSSLRFALYHALKYEKQHIIYVAPFQSILEQNAEEIRTAIGRGDIVLEHHCSVMHETEEEKKRYEELTENWLSPVIVTTAVQMLNTLYDGKTGAVRRMHSLCNSIILFDEVQSLPIRTVELFNLAVNFLTNFCNSTVVLCSATQPVFDELPRNSLILPRNMIGDVGKFETAFRRTALIDRTMIKPGGIGIAELGDFVLDQFRETKQILIIVNTKSCAQNLYYYLDKQDIINNLFHLSTNMHALNRREELEKMKRLLAKEQPVVCVSTQIIEAGVDISFRCVIRSLAGLDSVIQAAGRCNRNAKYECGNVYIVKMNEKAEVLSGLPDIKKAQEAMESVLLYRRKKAPFLELTSEEMKQQYYRRYFLSRKDETRYPVTLYGTGTDLVDLLSGGRYAKNRFQAYYNGKKEYKKCFLNQEFKTAGELFEVISEDGRFPVVVECGEYTSERIAELETGECTSERKREILRELQLVTVGISQSVRNSIGNGIYPAFNRQLFVLRENYYSDKIGVMKEPKLMETLMV